MVYSFCSLVLNLCVVSVFTLLSLKKKLEVLMEPQHKPVGSASYVDIQLTHVLFTCRCCVGKKVKISDAPTPLDQVPLSLPIFDISTLGANLRIYGMEIYCSSSEK